MQKTSLICFIGALFLLTAPAGLPAGAAAQEKKAPQEKPEKEAGPAKKDAPAPPLDEATRQALEDRLHKAEEEYRLYFRKPQTVVEYWTAIRYELDVGKFDLAALFLEQLLKKQPAEEVDRELALLEEFQGMAPFLRLLQVRQWDKNPTLQKQAEANVQLLLQRLTAAVERRLGEPARLRQLIASLGADTREERQYALVQLRRSGARAIPYLLDAFLQAPTPVARRRLEAVLAQMDDQALLPLREVLRARTPADAQRVDLRLALVDLIRRRDDRRFLPDLWYVWASPRYPAVVRQQAAQTLASLLRTEPERLPAAVPALTEWAEKHYRHQQPYLDPQRVPLWKWDGKQLARQPTFLTAGQADLYYGLLYADEALELDPSYVPAQQLYTRLLLTRTFGTHLNRILEQRWPDDLHLLLARLDAGFLADLLEQALGDRDLPVILALVRLLGEQGAVRAAQRSPAGHPGPLVLALYYPEARVQLAAVQALLPMPQTPEPATAQRLVEILCRWLETEPPPQVLVVGLPADQTGAARQTLKQAGLEMVSVSRPAEIWTHLSQTTAVEAIFLYPSFPLAELPYWLSQLRADADAGLLPIWLLAPPAAQEQLSALARRFRQVRVQPVTVLAQPDLVQVRLEEDRQLAQAPAWLSQLPASQRSWVAADLQRREGVLLSAAERQQFAKQALELLERLARGDRSGYDLAARAPLLRRLASAEWGPLVAPVLAYLPGADVQEQLAAVALDHAAGKRRLPSAQALVEHVRRFGLLLPAPQLAALRRQADDPQQEAALRTAFSLVLSQQPARSRQTGDYLRRYSPMTPTTR